MNFGKADRNPVTPCHVAPAKSAKVKGKNRKKGEGEGEA